MREPVVIRTVFRRIDFETCEAFGSQLGAALGEDAAQTVVVDLSAVEFMSSVGLRELVVASKKSTAAGGTIVITGLQPLVREVFTISRFDLLFPLYDTTRDALTALGAVT